LTDVAPSPEPPSPGDIRVLRRRFATKDVTKPVALDYQVIADKDKRPNQANPSEQKGDT
jgi:hypothetical protein